MTTSFIVSLYTNGVEIYTSVDNDKQRNSTMTGCTVVLSYLTLLVIQVLLLLP